MLAVAVLLVLISLATPAARLVGAVLLAAVRFAALLAVAGFALLVAVDLLK